MNDSFQKLTGSILLSAIFLFGLFAFIPARQDPGRQVNVFSGATITTTARTAVTACGQGDGAVGRKTLVVHNGSGSSGAVTVTAELRTGRTAANFTSGYMAVNGVATNTLTHTTVAATGAAGRFCQISAVSASTGTVTVTLRRE